MARYAQKQIIIVRIKRNSRSKEELRESKRKAVLKLKSLKKKKKNIGIELELPFLSELVTV